jgi:amino acid adenylation domain-containing protein
MSVVDRLAALNPEQRALFERLREEQRRAAAAPRRERPPLRRIPGPRPASFPLSYAQQRLWFLHQLDPDVPAYNLGVAVRLRGDLSRPALAAAIAEVARRHEALRTRFALDQDEPVQVIDPPPAAALRRIDLSALAGEDELRRLVRREVARPFDLVGEPPFRTVLFQLAPDEHFLLATLHHIVADGWSGAVLVQEVGAAYQAALRGRPSPLPEPPVQYADFAVWQRGWLAGETLRAELDWWRDRLAGAPPRLELPADRPRQGAGWRAGKLPMALPADLSRRLTLLGQRAGATPFVTLMAGFQLLVGRYSGAGDLTVTTVVANRMQPEVEQLIGFFVNTLILRARLAEGLSFRDHLLRARAEMLAAAEHQEVSFEQVVEAVRPERAAGEIPFFQTLFVLQNTARQEAELPGLTLAGETAESGTARVDLALELFAGPDGFFGSWEYRADLFDATTIARLAEQLCHLLQAAADDPQAAVLALPLLAPAERQQILVEWNQSGTPAPDDRAVHEVVAGLAAARPAATALVFPGGSWTYGELERRAGALALRLRARGVGAETIVALCAERSPEMVMGALAVLKAGGAYLPLDPGYPAERLLFLWEDAGRPLVLAPEALFAVLPEPARARWEPLPARGEEAPQLDFETVPVDGDQLAYVIYTSGSTGRPKGTLVPHRDLRRRLDGLARALGIGPGSRVLQLFSFSFDMSVAEIFGALTGGAELHLITPEEALPGPALVRTLRERRITFSYATPQVLLASPVEELPDLEMLAVGGEAVGPEVAAIWGAGRRFVNGYGPTEAVIAATLGFDARPGPRSAARPPIGRPLDGTRIYLLDPRLEPVPVGVTGELWIAGAGLARGYLARPDLTADRFRPDAFAALWSEPGARMYRSGDLARHLPDGEIDFLGRIDAQVKIRGFRIEPGEIEALLLAHPRVREAVVVAREDWGAERRLVAYCTAAASDADRAAGVPADLPVDSSADVRADMPVDPSADPSADVHADESADVSTGLPVDSLADESADLPAILRAHLAARLPAYMVPAAFVLLPELPLNANAKVDRARLPLPGEPVADAPPRTPAEELVAGIWADVLDLPRVGRSANFFDLGGHSLLATRVVSRLREAAGVELPVRELFQSPTVASLAAALETAISSAAAGAAGVAAPPIRPVPRTADLPLSFAQERLWFLDRLAPGNVGYHIPLALTARGALSLPALAAALGEMVRRHEALRTTFAARGDRPVQVVAAPSRREIPLIDLAALADAPRRQEARRLAALAVAQPFDLERDPMLRAHAVRLAAEEHALLLVVHHIAADGWSIGVMVEEIAALYPAAQAAQAAQAALAALAAAPVARASRDATVSPSSLAAPLAAEAAPLPALAVQYADFAVWQRAWLQGEVLERQLAYWRERLAGAPVLDLPTDRTRPPVQSFRGATRMGRVPAETARALQSFARRQGATPFMVLLATVQSLLGRYAGQEDVVVGSPIANRNRSEIEPLIGFFVNSLALRGDLSGDPTFGELVARSRRAALAAYSHQDLPFERLVEELRPERRLSHNPLFQVMFAVQNAPLGAIDLPGLTFEPIEIEFPATRFDLEIFFSELGGGLAVQLTWSTDLFDATTVLRLEEHLDALLAAAIADPALRLSEIPLLAAPARHQLQAEWNDSAAEIPASDVAALFAEQARLRPDAVAVSSDEGDLTYAELEGRAARLARRLAAAGVGPEVRVALLAQRSPALIVGLLGILKAGGAYVPLDPSYPAERLAWMLADSASRVLLGQRELLAELPEGSELSAPGRPGDRIERIELAADLSDLSAVDGPDLTGPLPGGLAYVMYTSGSTGRPKGVGVTHRNIVRLVRWSGFADLGPDQVFLQLAPISFDASTLEIWAPLLNGGRVAIFPPRRPSLEELGEAICRFGVTSLWLTAGLFHQMVESNLEALRPLRQLLAGGDVLSPARVRRALAGLPDVTLINGYGPTEGTTFTCCFPMTDPDAAGASVPIGRPIGNTRVYVVDPELRPVPIGVRGELCVAGEGLSRGYLGSPETTAERFLPDPFGAAGEPGSRLYRTGDVVRCRADGRLEFLGRRDGQVKLRGFRVEVGEIESALARHPRVGAAAVLLRDDGGPAGRRLVAYVAARPGAGAGDERAGDPPATAPPALANAGAVGRVERERRVEQVERAEVAEHVERWRELYDQTYTPGPPVEAGGDAAFNLQGWNSSYTGEPIPAVEMREWLDGTVGRLLALPHRRVLEVGCGTGLLLFRVAPETERYRGTDFSGVALAQVRAELGRRALPQVELAQGLADDWSGVEPGSLDLVVLNSVVQYFPGVDYLVRVLEGAVAALAPGGAVFVGDVRSLPLLEAFHASVELHRAAAALPAAELLRRVRRRTADEEELVVDPALFLALARRLPALRGAQVLLKRGRQANELTRFRYDVILRRDGGEGALRQDRPSTSSQPPPPLPPSSSSRPLRRSLQSPAPEAWDDAGLGLAGLEARLAAEGPEELVLSGVPDARLAGEAAALEVFAGAGREMETVAELRAEVERLAFERRAIEPEDLWALADRLGYEAELTWLGSDGAGGGEGTGGAGGTAGVDSAGSPTGAAGRFDAVLRRRGAAPPALTATNATASVAAIDASAAGAAAVGDDLPWSAWANDPLRADQARRLVPELRRFLESELPDYMVPSAFVLLEALPLTPNGKVDRAALPEPERGAEVATEWIAPASPLEETLASVAAEVLGLERVGMGDNFFDLGGHSLLATQLVSRLVQNHALPVSLQMVFDSPTLADLADQIVARELASAESGLLAEMLSELEGLPPEELLALSGQSAPEGAR